MCVSPCWRWGLGEHCDQSLTLVRFTQRSYNPALGEGHPKVREHLKLSEFQFLIFLIFYLVVFTFTAPYSLGPLMTYVHMIVCGLKWLLLRLL